VKGPLVVWLVVAVYFGALILLASSSGGAVPQQLTLGVVLLLLANMLIAYGPVLLFLAVVIAVWERKRSVRDIFAGLGFRTRGFVRSMFWSVALFPVYAVIGLLSMLVAPYVAPSSGSGSIPPWYPYYMVLYAFFPVAIVEEAFGRGYLLDRLMPGHPSSLIQAAPAIFLSSFLFTLWHLPSYLVLYSFSPTRTFLLLAANVFPLSVVLAVAYVRARARNVAGPVFIHFLLDALPYVLFVVL
jgi:membrane protease YdiL (CAAX protease family)